MKNDKGAWWPRISPYLHALAARGHWPLIAWGESVRAPWYPVEVDASKAVNDNAE